MRAADLLDEGASIDALARAIAARRVSVVALVEATLDRIAARGAASRAIVAVDADRSRRRAEALDAELAAGRSRGALHGIPLGFKDCLFVAGLPNGCGTGAPDYWTADTDCAAARRLGAAGAIAIGKLAMTELAMGTFGINEGRGTPENPRAPDRIPGGSSSGSGVAVAASLVPAALGTDTGGSIRLPAACCGIVGLKPTFGRVSRAGVMPLSPTLDHVGFLARAVGDLALLLAATAGADPDDDATGQTSTFDSGTLASVGGLVVGVPDGGVYRDVEPVVAAALAEAARALAAAGATVRLVALPDPGPLMDATAVIVRAEAAAMHERARDDARAALSPFVRGRLDAGVTIPATRYVRAVADCRSARRAFLADAFASVDALLVPMTPGLPPTLAEATSGSVERVSERMARFARFARLWNGLGAPALAMPAYASRELVPAVQLAARPFDDAVVLRLGVALEAARAS